MKKLHIPFIAYSIIIIFGLFILFTTLSSFSIDKKTSVLSMTASVDVPENGTLAGETIDLSRYDLHERYDREINGFTYLHSTTLLLIKRANRIFPIIVPILQDYGIPEDFKYLAVIESSLDPRAYSSAKAAGLWQLMPATGKEYGLEITSEVDERYSIQKSTEAACKYLRAAYNRYGSWSSVAISYNAGMGRISGELEKQQALDGVDLWLVSESYRYYFRMLAIKNIFENPYKYGYVLRANQLYKPIEFTEVEVSQSIPDLSIFAKQMGCSYAELKDFNSWLRDRQLTISSKSAQTYKILIPKQNSLYYQKKEKIKPYDKNWVVD